MAGSRWWKVDFHTHTPASSDYGKGKNQSTFKARSPSEWLLDFMVAGIDCVVVTDHNSGAWIDKLKQALKDLEESRPEGYRALTLFPGVEISAGGGVHVLAVLDPRCGTEEVSRLLGAVGYKGGSGETDVEAEQLAAAVCSKIDEAGGIAIPAHVDKPKGLFKASDSLAIETMCRHDKVFAMEAVALEWTRPQVYENIKPGWTQVLGSDAHHPSGETGQHYPGSHFTWVKMGAPCLAGLRLALLDGSLSTRRSDAVDEDPNRHAPFVLESFEVSDARYLGRGKSLLLRFSPWLNTLIGGRGTGKSTLIELMRAVLRREDEIPEALKEDLAKYRKVTEKRDDDGVLTKTTHLTLTCRKDGKRFRVQWSADGGAEPISEEGAPDEWSSTSGKIPSRFPVRIYSQKQVYQLAKAPGALLQVIDEAAAGGGRPDWDERWREETSRYLAFGANVRQLESEIGEEPHLRGELVDIKRKLAVFEDAGHADVLKDFQRRRRQQRAVETWEQGLGSQGERIRELARDLIPDELEDPVFDDTQALALCKIASDTRDRVKAIYTQLEKLASDADAVAAHWKRARGGSAWAGEATTAESSYEALKTKLAEEGAGDPAAYGRLVQDRQGVEQRLNRFSEQRGQIAGLKNQAKASAVRLEKLRREQTETRTEFLSQVLKGNKYVEITVVPYGATSSIEREIRKILRRESGGFEKDMGAPGAKGGQGLLSRFDPQSVIAEDDIRKLKEDIRAIAKAPPGRAEVRDQRFASHLAGLNPEAFDRLDFWFPEDALKVRYSASSDGKNFRSIEEGSPGQKTAALLAFLLSHGEEPLLLDQPEDDLDNHLIYNLIVMQLREVKARRQLIIVTHNPNIVVNGDAEQVLALQPCSGQSCVEAEGSLQDPKIRATICDVMEGGRLAFDRRYRRIFVEGGHA